MYIYILLNERDIGKRFESHGKNDVYTYGIKILKMKTYEYR